MKQDLVLAIDQGTTGTTVMAVNSQLDVVARANREFRQIFPRSGWVEHDLEHIWRSTLETIDEVLQHFDAGRVAAIGITNQRETVGLWRRDDGTPLHHAIVWQCRRTADMCRELKEAGHEARIRELTGLVVDPYFSGTKARWLFDHVDGARAAAEAGDAVVGTIDTFLVHRLTGFRELVTDVSNASRTLLMDLAKTEWSPELLELLGVPRSALAEIRSSSEVFGTTRGVPGLPDGIPVAGIAGDQQAALFGQACFDEGDVKCTYGTGAFILMNTGAELVRSEHGLITTVGWRLGPDAPTVYALEGSVFIAGAAVQWLRDGLGIIRASSEVEALALSVEDSGDVVFVPALVGLGAPHWRTDAKGMIRGIGRDTTSGHLARATLEGIALQVHEVVEATRKDAGPIHTIRVDGGASANDLLMQTQAELAQQAVLRPDVIETTAAGAAFLAGLATQVFPSLETIKQRWRLSKRFEPRDPQLGEHLLAKWRDALSHL